MEEDELIGPKEIKIKLKVPTLKAIGCISVVVILIALLVLEFFFPISPYCNANLTKESEVVGPVVEEPEVAVETPAAETVVEESKVNETEEPEGDLLPITGEVSITIDKINIDPKPNIEDYAKVTSVQFTIKNQDKDFTPTVKGYLLLYAGEDVKDVTLDELEAGKSITATKTELNFGYNQVDEERTLVLEVYNENNKMLKKATKEFTTPSD